MELKQISAIINAAVGQANGTDAPSALDAKSVVDLGKEALGTADHDAFTGKLIDGVGRLVFENSKYSSWAPSLYRDSWEYGSIMESVAIDKLTPAQDDPAWNLKSGSVVEQDAPTIPSTSVLLFNKRDPFEVPLTVSEIQLKSAFQSPAALSGFMDYLFNKVDIGMKDKVDAAARLTVGAGILTATEAGKQSQATTRVINLLAAYNAAKGTTLTAEQAMLNSDFLKYSGFIIRGAITKIQRLNVNFNKAAAETFTPKDRINLLLGSAFASATSTYLESSTFHNDLVQLPGYDEIPFWQAPGKNVDVSADVTSPIDSLSITLGSGTSTVTKHVVGVLHDRLAMGIMCEQPRVTSHRNDHGEFTNYWYKSVGCYFVDPRKNCIVFTLD